MNPSDLAGFSRLSIDAVTGVTSLVEAMHDTIAQRVTPSGISGLVYEAIRGTTKLVGLGIDAGFSQILPYLDESPSTPEREAVLAAVNGAWGDYLAATENPLAIPMRLRIDGRPLPLDKQSLASTIPRASGKVLILAHALCMNDLQWTHKGHNHGAALAQDLGYTPVYLHYNSGVHISTNGRAFADLIEKLLAEWPMPIDDLAIVAHSMGGLVARSACHYGAANGHQWPARLRNLVFLGAPHHGSPLERIANMVDLFLQSNPYSAPLARPGKTRSAGITDLRYGNLLDEDWESVDRFANSGDTRRPVPLPDDVDCFAIAGSVGQGTARSLLGDGLVPLDSALGRHENAVRLLDFPESRVWVAEGVNHFDLLSDGNVYQRIRMHLLSASGR